MNRMKRYVSFAGLWLAMAFMVLSAAGAKEVTENLTLDSDLDWSSEGTVTIAAGVIVNLNGHKLVVKNLSCEGTILAKSAFRYFRFKVDAVQSGNALQIGELKLFYGEQEVTQSYSQLTYGSASTWPGQGYGPDKCLDGNLDTKWYDDGNMDNNWLVLEYAMPIRVTRYEWYTADDTKGYPGRNPCSWRLQGSNDGVIWSDLERVDAATGLPIENKTLAYTGDLTAGMEVMGTLEVFVPQGETATLSCASIELGSLVKSGEGTLRLSLPTDFANIEQVSIAAGKVVQDGEGAAAEYSQRQGAVTVAAGATLDLHGHRLAVKGLSCVGTITSDTDGARLVACLSDGAAYAVSGTCEVAVEIADGSALASNCDLTCFGTNVVLDGVMMLEDWRLLVAGLSGSGIVSGCSSNRFRYIRFEVLAPGVLQVGEFKLFSGNREITRDYTNLTYGSSSQWITSYGPDKCLDGDLDTSWFDEGAASQHWFVLEYAEPITVTKYQWYTAADTKKYPERNPYSWRLQGSNDGVIWSDLERVDAATGLPIENKTLAYTGDLTAGMEATGTLEVFVPQGETATLAMAKLVDFGSLVKSGEGTLRLALTEDLACIAEVSVVAGKLVQAGEGAILIDGVLSGNGAIAGANVRFSGQENRWTMTLGDDGFTSKVDFSGVTDADLLRELKVIDIAWEGTTALNGKMFDLVQSGSMSQKDLDVIELVIKDGMDSPIDGGYLLLNNGRVVLSFGNKTKDTPVTATWTGLGGDDDVDNPDNWDCRNSDGEPMRTGVLPSYETTIFLSGDCKLNFSTDKVIGCQRLEVEGLRLTADCDWRGIAGIPVDGEIKLDGHKLQVGSLVGNTVIYDEAVAAFKFYRFKVNKTRGAIEHADNLKELNDSLRISEFCLINGTNDLTRPYKALYYQEDTFNHAKFGNFTPDKAVDGIFVDTNGGWYDDRQSKADLQDDVWFTLEYDEPKAVTHYEWCSGSDSGRYSYRQPQKWQLEGSNDGTTWTMIDQVDKRMAGANAKLCYQGVVNQDGVWGEVQLEVPAGATVINETVSLYGRLRLVKVGEGTFVAAKNGQTYGGGTYIDAGILKSVGGKGSNVALGNDSLFGLWGTKISIADGAQYWEDNAEPWGSLHYCFSLAGNGPDGNGAIYSTSMSYTCSINSPVNGGWCEGLELAADATVMRVGRETFRMVSPNLDFTLALNGHTLALMHNGISAANFTLQNVRSEAGDSGTIFVGGYTTLEVAVRAVNDAWMYNDLSGDKIIISEYADYETLYGGNTFVGDLIIRGGFRHSSTGSKETTVLNSYAPVEQEQQVSPNIVLGDAEHLTPILDLSERTEPFYNFDSLRWAEGVSRIRIHLGSRQVKEDEPLITWSEPPANMSFKGIGGKCIVKPDGLYYAGPAGMMIMVY